MLFLGILSIQCKIRHDRPVTLSDRSVDVIDLLVTPGIF